MRLCRPAALLLNSGRLLGISHDEAEDLFTDAERIASAAGDIGSRAILLSTYGALRGVGDGDLPEYARLSREAIALAEESGDPALYVAVATSSYALWCTGKYREGVAICTRAIELADGDPTVGAGISLGCPYAFCHGRKAWNLAELGGLDDARKLIEQGRKIAREQGDIEMVAL